MSDPVPISPDVVLPPRRRRGRPPSWDAAKAEKVVELVRGGNHVETSCVLAGVARSSYYNWLRRGADGEQPYRDFALAVDQAAAEAEARAVETIEGAARTDWRAAGWLLSHSRQRHWGTHTAIDVTVTLRQQTDRLADQLGLNPDEVFEEAQRLLKEMDDD